MKLKWEKELRGREREDHHFEIGLYRIGFESKKYRTCYMVSLSLSLFSFPYHLFFVLFNSFNTYFKTSLQFFRFIIRWLFPLPLSISLHPFLPSVSLHSQSTLVRFGRLRTMINLMSV